MSGGARADRFNPALPYLLLAPAILYLLAFQGLPLLQELWLS